MIIFNKVVQSNKRKNKLNLYLKAKFWGQLKILNYYLSTSKILFIIF